MCNQVITNNITLCYMLDCLPDNMRVVELFAGVGGFRVGLEAASKDYFKTIWANQWEPGSERKQFAFNCYNSHFSEGIKVNADINAVLNQVPEHDLLVGGFPCQDYSVASTGAKGIVGKKGVLWWAINEIVEKRKPRYIFLENVDRLIKSPTKQRGRDFGIILRCLADCGYYVEWRVINAADYGMPQKRRRIFIFAARNDQKFVKSLTQCSEDEITSKKGFFARAFKIVPDSKEKTIFKYDISKQCYPELTDISDNFAVDFNKCGLMRNYKICTHDFHVDYSGPFETLGEKLEDTVDERYYQSDTQTQEWKYLKGSKSLVRKAPDGSEYLYTEGRIPFPDRLDIAGRTMLTSEGLINRSSHLICDPNTGRYRIITPRECERLNGFPDDWTANVMTERQRYFCMGNALVVPIVTRMGLTLKSIEEEYE